MGERTDGINKKIILCKKLHHFYGLTTKQKKLQSFIFLFFQIQKFGVSWQVIPKQLGGLLAKDKSGRVMNAMLKMKKIVIKDLEQAYIAS